MKYRVGKIALVAVFVALALAKFGLRHGFQWGPTNIEVIETYRPQFAPLHATLQKLAEQVAQDPPIGAVQVPDALAPQAVMHFGDPEGSNMSLIALVDLQSYQVFDPMNSSKLTPEDLEGQRFSSSDFDEFEHAINWTGEANPLSGSVWDDDGSDMEQTLKHALAVRYLLVGRTRPIDAEHADSPALACDVFLADLQSGEIVARIPLLVSAEESGSTESTRAKIIAGVSDALGDRADVHWVQNP